MAALTGERDTPNRDPNGGIPWGFPQATNTKIWNGAIVMLSATGFATPGADTANAKAQGRANQTSDTTAAGPGGVLADGVQTLETNLGIFEYDNPVSANQLTQADVGRLGYVLSDHEVCRAAGTVNSVIAGKVMSIDLVRNKAVIDFRVKAI